MFEWEKNATKENWIVFIDSSNSHTVVVYSEKKNLDGKVGEEGEGLLEWCPFMQVFGLALSNKKEQFNSD